MTGAASPRPSRRTAAATGQDWDVLGVGYASRRARDLRTAVNARHDRHAPGAVINVRRRAGPVL